MATNITEQMSQMSLEASSSSQPPPRHSNLYVANLPTSIDSEASLRSLFSQYGTIETLRLVRNSRSPEGKSFAFVKFAKVPDALAAINALNNTQVGNSMLEVKIADADAGDRNPELLAPPSDNLYAKNLPYTLTEDELRSLFSPYGAVIECRVLHSGAGRDAGAGAGALIRMASMEEAAQAIAHLHNQRLAGSTLPLVVRYADSQEQKAKKAARQHRQYERFGHYGPPHGGPPAPYMQHHPHHPQQHSEHSYYAGSVGSGGYGSGTCSVYIKYLPEQTDRLWLYEKFAPFGAVLSVKVLTNEQGLCKGVGFINYGDPEAAGRAVAAMNGMPIGSERRLYVALQTHRSR